MTAQDKGERLWPKWRTKDTAPKDAPFWGKVGKNAIWMYWDEDFKEFVSDCRLMELWNGYTFGDGTTKKKHSPEIHKPTHWLPLPPPPGDEE